LFVWFIVCVHLCDKFISFVYIKPLVKYRFNPNIQSYVDEYEWGVNAVPADGVNSYCRAKRWA